MSITWSPARTILIVGTVAAFFCWRTAGKIKDPSEYRLQVTILEVTQNMVRGEGGYHGSGYANIREAGSWEGVAYKFEGCPFLVHASNTSYMARWKKERKQLALVINGAGKEQVECDLNVRLDGVVYAVSPLGKVIVYEKK
jgi:hypothetical protein